MNKKQSDACVELVEVGRVLAAAGLCPGSTGNLSARVDDTIVCTPGGSTLGALNPTGLSILNLDGSLREGPPPTKEQFMHAAVYGANDSAQGIVHLHSPYATAVSCLDGLDENNAIVPMTPYLTMRAGSVALIPYAAPGSRQIVGPLERWVREGRRALLLSNHGSIAIGDSLGDAVAIAQEIEQAAMMELLTAGMPVRKLSASQRSELRL